MQLVTYPKSHSSIWQIPNSVHLLVEKTDAGAIGSQAWSWSAERTVLPIHETTRGNPRQDNVLHKAGSASTAPTPCGGPNSETKGRSVWILREGRAFQAVLVGTTAQSRQGRKFPCRGTLGKLQSPSKERAILRRCAVQPLATSAGDLFTF